MPEPHEQPEPEAPKRPKAAAGAAKLEKLKKKYRLDEQVDLYAKGANGLRMGKGPLIDPQVFSKFADLDTSPDKRYLDWMLFQAGGGAEAFQHSRKLWGDTQDEVKPDVLFKKFKEAHPDPALRYDELRTIAQKLKDKGLNIDALLDKADLVTRISEEPNLHGRFTGIVQLIKKLGVVPGKEEKVAAELVSNKFKSWIKNQLSTVVRDRVHATFIFNRVLRGISPQDAEAKWAETAEKRRREYIYGDQDSLKWDTFGFNRHWPGRNNIYENVFNEMRQFIINKERVDKYAKRLDTYNAQAKAKNAGLPPESQIPLRTGLGINMDIGVVTDSKKNGLVYTGSYPTVSSLAQLNAQITDLPMRERVTRDVQYAGPKGTRSNKAKVYSDENIDVLVPLTVAASIKAGHPAWSVADPAQLDKVKSKGSAHDTGWFKYASGNHGMAEWFNTQAIPIFFILKGQADTKDVQKLMMTVFLEDLTDLQPPYVATIWHIMGGQEELNFSSVVATLKRNLDHATYIATMKSISSAMKVIREWGKEFNPQDIIGDYIGHHREKMQGKRTLGEAAKFRAKEVVEALLE